MTYTNVVSVALALLLGSLPFHADQEKGTIEKVIRDLRIDLSRSGDVAWWSCILDDLGEWDGKPIGWKDTRWTGVMEKRDGKWLIVQMHFSFASDKIAAGVEAKVKKTQ